MKQPWLLQSDCILDILDGWHFIWLFHVSLHPQRSFTWPTFVTALIWLWPWCLDLSLGIIFFIPVWFFLLPQLPFQQKKGKICILMDLSNSRGPLNTVLFTCTAATVDLHIKKQQQPQQQKVLFHMGPKIYCAFGQINTSSRKLVWIVL